MTKYDIRKHYEASVAGATDAMLVAMIRRDLDADMPVLDVLEELAIEEAARRGHALPTLWALSARI